MQGIVNQQLVIDLHRDFFLLSDAFFVHDLSFYLLDTSLLFPPSFTMHRFHLINNSFLSPFFTNQFLSFTFPYLLFLSYYFCLRSLLPFSLSLAFLIDIFSSRFLFSIRMLLSVSLSFPSSLSSFFLFYIQLYDNYYFNIFKVRSI